MAFDPQIPNAKEPVLQGDNTFTLSWRKWLQLRASTVGGSGVTSLDNLIGAITLIAGPNITLTASSSTNSITIAAASAPPVSGFVTATGNPAAGQNTVWAGGTSITSGAITMPVASPAHADRFDAIIVNTSNSGTTLSHGAIADESTFAVVDATGIYASSDFSPTYTGNDTSGAIIIAGANADPTYSGLATSGHGSILYGGNFIANFKGTGTLDNAFGMVAGPDVFSGVVTNGVGVYSFIQTDGGQFTSGTAFEAQSIFHSGTAIGTYVAFLDQPDVGTSPTVAWGFRQTATNHPNFYGSTSEFSLYTQHDYLTAFEVVATDTNKRLVSIANSTAGFVLTSNGAGTIPTFQASGGGGGNTWIPLVDGHEPPAFITDGAGSLITVAYAP